MNWLRLWHEMPTDPKWRTIARRSGQSISTVIAVYNFLLVNASANSDERGTLKNWTNEDVASCLDISEEDVAAVCREMQGRVLDGDTFINWRKLQPPSDASNRPMANEWIETRQRIFKRDNYTCRYCSIRGGRLECDHVVPVSRGGSHEDDNLATACFTCNRSKRDKTVEEWLQ